MVQKQGILQLSSPKLEPNTLALSLDKPNKTIPINACQDGTRYLRLYLTTDHNTKPLEAHLWQKALVFTLAFQQTAMSPWEAGILYQSCFIPALTYPLPVLWLLDQFFEKVHHLSTSTILNKMGYHRNLLQCLVFAPWLVGSIGLCNLHYKMGAQHLIILLWHMCTGTPLGQTMEILTRMYQVWAGLETSILVNTCPCLWVLDKWISWIRQTMHSHNIKIIYNVWTYKPLQTNNVHIMETLMDTGLKTDHLEQLNTCHMHLQVTMLVEITDHTGTRLIPHAFSNQTKSQPTGLSTVSHSLLAWPNVHNPSPSSWKLWTKTIHTIYTSSTTGDKLHHPLGEWTPEYDRY